MPCPHIGGRTLAAHNRHLENSCQDYPTKHDSTKEKMATKITVSYLCEKLAEKKSYNTEVQYYRMINTL